MQLLLCFLLGLISTHSSPPTDLQHRPAAAVSDRSASAGTHPGTGPLHIAHTPHAGSAADRAAVEAARIPVADLHQAAALHSGSRIVGVARGVGPMAAAAAAAGSVAVRNTVGVRAGRQGRNSWDCNLSESEIGSGSGSERGTVIGSHLRGTGSAVVLAVGIVVGPAS